jgi:hypothetical protein
MESANFSKTLAETDLHNGVQFFMYRLTNFKVCIAIPQNKLKLGTSSLGHISMLCMNLVFAFLSNIMCHGDYT